MLLKIFTIDVAKEVDTRNKLNEIKIDVRIQINNFPLNGDREIFSFYTRWQHSPIGQVSR